MSKKRKTLKNDLLFEEIDSDDNNFDNDLFEDNINDDNDLNEEEEEEEEDIYANETAAEKRIRLAKELLDKYQMENKSDDDSNEDSDDNLSDNIENDSLHNKLQQDVLKSKYQYQNQIANNIQIDHDNIKFLRGHKGAVTCICINKDNTRAYTGGKDGAIIQWNLITGKKLLIFNKLNKKIKKEIAMERKNLVVY